MKLNFNIQYNAPARTPPRNDFERAFEQAVSARKNLAITVTKDVLSAIPAQERTDVAQVKNRVKESLVNAGLPEDQVHKVLSFVPFAMASNSAINRR